MGMYDDISFKYRMPDGFEGETYQSKDLNCACDQYEITLEGRLVRTYSSGYPDEVRLPLGDIAYDGNLNIYTSGWPNDKWHEYDLTFRAGTLVSIWCHQTESYLLFEPSLPFTEHRPALPGV